MESDEGKRLFHTYINSYVRSMIPRRAWTRRDIIDGEYEDQYTCNPPAVGMLIISLIEVISTFETILSYGAPFEGIS